MNYTIIENPYIAMKTVVNTRGVMTDSKVAKLNNDVKRPALVRHWEELMPKVTVATATPTPAPSIPSAPKDYHILLESVGITAVNHVQMAVNSGAKKLRVNKIVNEKARNVYQNSNKINIIPETPIMPPKQEEPEIKIESAFTPNVNSINDDLRGRHERNVEVPMNEIKEPKEVVSNIPSYTSRVEKGVVSDTTFKDITTRTEIKQEPKAGDMDLYNNLLHSVGQADDVSRQLQGARNQLSIEKEESRKLAEQYGEAVKELEKLKVDIEVTKKQKEQKAKEELSMTLKSIENLQKENLERTSDLTSIQSEIARLKAEKQAMEASSFE